MTSKGETAPTRVARETIETLDPRVLESLVGRSLFLTSDWSFPQIETLARVAGVFQQLDRARVRTPLFPEELFLSLFFDSSTRTRSSWAGAAARLGASPAIFDGTSTQVAHGETAAETGAMLGMNAHALGIRHDLILGEGNRFMREAHGGIARYLEEIGDERVVPLVNLQCDVDHPTQSLADLRRLQEIFSDGPEGKTIAVSWAYSPSYAKPLSVPQGLITLLPRFGMNVRLAAPPGYDLLPQCLDDAARFAEEGGGTFVRCDSMDEAFDGADVVYPKSWGPMDLMLERVEANRAGDRGALDRIEAAALERNRGFTDWICDERRMGLTRDGAARYMHCLPADIGAEVSPGVMDRFRTDVAREANHKVYVIMAMLAVAKEPRLVARLAEFTEGAVER